MRKSVASSVSESSSSEMLAPMLNGQFNPSFFRHLQHIYQTKTGYGLVLSDLNGSIQMGLPDCEKFPCMKSCRECREQIVSEALRTGKVCVDACHEGYILWGLPFAHGGRTIGGLIVIGGEQDIREKSIQFERACQDLYKLMIEYDLLPEGIVVSDDLINGVHRFVFRDTFVELTETIDLSGKPFIHALETAEFDTAKAHFAKIREAFLQSNQLPVDVLRGLVGDLIFRARQQFIHAGMDDYACCAEAGLLMEQVSAARDAHAIQLVLDAFLDRFIVLSRQRPKDPDDLLIEKATNYLERHIRDELTRETVAKAVGISPSHFSRLIREKKGRTFTDLLNQYRIENACKLLVRSSHTLAEIANETGFCDQSYFSKVFRRYKDITPARYRELHQL